MNDVKTLADALPAEQARCREILEHAIEIGAPATFLITCLRRSLAHAERAAATGDVVAMLSALNDLRSYKE